MGYYDDYLEHHGILGMKWGVRRFEDASGHLTAAGKARYNTDSNGDYKKLNYDSAKLSVKTAKANYKEAKSEYKKSYKDASKDVLNKEKRKYFTDSAKKYKDAEKELKESKEKLKAEKEANKKHLTKGQKAALIVAAAGAVTVGVLAVKHRKQIAEGASKVENILRSKKNEMVSNITAHKVESSLKKQTAANEAFNAKVAGMRKPFVERRKPMEEQAKELITKFYSDEAVDKAYRDARQKIWDNMTSKEDLARYKNLSKDSFIKEAGPSEGVKQIVNQWLNGETFQNKIKAEAFETNSIDYLEKVLAAYGYKRKSA